MVKSHELICHFIRLYLVPLPPYQNSCARELLLSVQKTSIESYKLTLGFSDQLLWYCTLNSLINEYLWKEDFFHWFPEKVQVWWKIFSFVTWKMSNMVEEKSKKATKWACSFIREFRVLPENWRKECSFSKNTNKMLIFLKSAPWVQTANDLCQAGNKKVWNIST